MSTKKATPQHAVEQQRTTVEASSTPGADEQPTSYMAAIIADRTHIATGDCLWFGQLAFATGQPVSSTHPGFPVWERDDLLRLLDQGPAAEA